MFNPVENLAMAQADLLSFRSPLQAEEVEPAAQPQVQQRSRTREALAVLGCLGLAEAVVEREGLTTRGQGRVHAVPVMEAPPQ